MAVNFLTRRDFIGGVAAAGITATILRSSGRR
ncbi:MAG: twin-arginine translocation signal domain-containing protein [Candidatus Binataceae bacterium]